MRRALILGGGGMLGQKLAALVSATEPDTQLTLFDIGFPESAIGTDLRIGTVSDPVAMGALLSERYDVIYHLASVVSGQAEQDFDLGWQVNLGGMQVLLTALRRTHEASGGAYVPRVVFTSSIAVFGGPYPASVPDRFAASPQSSYGAQKAICETLLQDYTRKGFVDGVSLRLPTICVRPGAPNAAASSFYSGIIREPLNGQEAILPVPDTLRHWFASPRAAVRFIHHAAGLDSAAIGIHRALNLPGVSCTVAEQIDALRRVAGQAAVDLIKPAADAGILQIVQGWPERFEASHARALGFVAEESFDEIIKAYIEDDLTA